MKSILILLFLLLGATPTAFGAQLTASVINGPGELGGGQLCAHREDSRTLLVVNNGKTIVRNFFCSSADPPATTAKLVKDRLGNYYVLLTYWTGRDFVSNMQEYLEIFLLPQNFSQLNPKKPIFNYLRVAIQGGAGPTSQWAYRYKIEMPTCGGLRFTFSRTIVGLKTLILFMPQEKTRTIEINTPLKCRD